MLLVGAYRDTEIGDGHPFTATLTELARLPAANGWSLTGLSEAEVTRVIALAAERTPDPRLARAVYAQTEGHPFFLVEVLRLLATEGSLDGTVPRPGHRRPSTVRAAIGQRLERLTPEGRRLLTAASVEGREFGLGVLGLVGEPEPDRLLELISEAEAAGVIVAVADTLDRYRFAHALVRDALYTGLPPSAGCGCTARWGRGWSG